MSRVIGQVWSGVVGCRNWPVMRVPHFIALRRNDKTKQNKTKRARFVADEANNQQLAM